MAQGRRKCIAFLLNHLSGTYQASFLASVEKAARRNDLNLIVAIGRELEHVDAQERAQNVVFTDWLGPASVDGVLILSAAISNFCGQQGLQALCRRFEPLPVCSIGLEIPGVPSIVISNRAGMRSAVEHLLRVHRRRRVAYIGGPPDNDEAAARFAGYREALDGAGIAYNEALVANGDFSSVSGERALREIATRTARFDALVAANDYMALGAMDELRQRGLQIAEDVLVVGFDDSPVARFASRSLSSVAQPTDHMADLAVQSLLRLMGQQPAEAVIAVDTQLVLRESCGCGYVVRSGSLVPPSPDSSGRATQFLTLERERLLTRLQPHSGSSRVFWPRWGAQLLDALFAELQGEVGTFLRRVDALTEEAADEGVPIDEIGVAIARLRSEFQDAGFRSDARVDLERLWMKAMTIQSAATTRREGRTALNLMTRAIGLRQTSQRLSVALSPWALSSALEQSLPGLGIDSALLALTSSERPGLLQPVFASRGGKPISLPSEPYPEQQLLPDGFWPDSKRWALVLLALTFETNVLGLMLFDTQADPLVCESLRAQVGGSLMLRSLHQRIVAETALRERLAREQLQGEMAIARRLQTALSPRVLEVPALRIAASMLPADEVGGDYYDVVALPEAAWIGIGDVTGHGLLSGLVMLMIQSIVGTLVRARPNAKPSELVVDLNAGLVPNIRERLVQEEHATFMLLRYTPDGRVDYAGAHEDLVVYRSAERRCEILPSVGVWIGIRKGIEDVTVDQSLQLGAGDVLVLYTDGITEAQNAHFEQFGIARVAELVERNATESVESLLSKLLSAVREWSPTQRDDLTCLVLRYEPPG